MPDQTTDTSKGRRTAVEPAPRTGASSWRSISRSIAAIASSPTGAASGRRVVVDPAALPILLEQGPCCCFRDVCW